MNKLKKTTSLFGRSILKKTYKFDPIRYSILRKFSFAREKEEINNDFNLKEYLNDFSDKSNSIYKKVLNICEVYDKNNDLSDLKKKLSEIGMNESIPDYAYTILIDKYLLNKQYSDVLKIIEEADKNEEILDIPLYEDLLFQFVLNDFQDGISSVLKIYEKYFEIPSINILIYSKNALDKKLIDESVYYNLFNSFMNNNIEKISTDDNLESFIKIKQTQLAISLMDKIKLDKRGRILDYQYKKNNISEIEYEKIDQNDPNLNKNDLEKKSVKNEFEFYEEERDNDDHDDEIDFSHDIKSVGYIELFIKNSKVDNKMKIGFKFVPDDFENSEDFTTDDGNDNSSSEEIDDK